MRKAVLLFSTAFSLCISSQRCSAQETTPVIYLSVDEAAKAKQAAQDLKSAQDRNSRAAAEWRAFNLNFQAAHPDLPNLVFSSDFRIAFRKRNVSNPFPLEIDAETVELSAEQRKKAESLHQETLDAKRLLDQAQKSWVDYQHELLVDHLPPNPPGGLIVTLPGGKSATIPVPWGNGAVFTPDFRIAVPR